MCPLRPQGAIRTCFHVSTLTLSSLLFIANPIPTSSSSFNPISIPRSLIHSVYKDLAGPHIFPLHIHVFQIPDLQRRVATGTSGIGAWSAPVLWVPMCAHPTSLHCRRSRGRMQCPCSTEIAGNRSVRGVLFFFPLQGIGKPGCIAASGSANLEGLGPGLGRRLC